MDPELPPDDDEGVSVRPAPAQLPRSAAAEATWDFELPLDDHGIPDNEYELVLPANRRTDVVLKSWNSFLCVGLCL